MHQEEKHPPYAVLLLLVLLGLAARTSWLDRSSQELERSREMDWNVAVVEQPTAAGGFQGMVLTMPAGRWTHQGGRGGTRGQGAFHIQPVRSPDVGGFASAEEDRERRARYLLVMEKTAQLEGLDAEARDLEAQTRRVAGRERQELLAQVTRLQSGIQRTLEAVRGAGQLPPDGLQRTAHLQRRVAELRTRVEQAPGQR